MDIEPAQLDLRIGGAEREIEIEWNAGAQSQVEQTPVEIALAADVVVPLDPEAEPCILVRQLRRERIRVVADLRAIECAG